MSVVDRYVVVTKEALHALHHFLAPCPVGEENLHAALCGARLASTGGWIVDSAERATCQRCIDRLPTDVRAELYPITHDVSRSVASREEAFPHSTAHGEAFTYFRSIPGINRLSDEEMQTRWPWFLRGWLAKAKQSDALRGSRR